MTDDLAAPPLRDLPPGRLEVRKQQLLSEIARTPERRRLSLPTWRPIAVVAVVTAVAVVLVSVFGRGGSPAGPSPAAAAAFHKLARLVAAQSLTPGSGQYLDIKVEHDWGAFSGNCETRHVGDEELWIGADGSGLDRETSKPSYFPSSADRAACRAQGITAGQEGVRTTSDWFAPRCLQLGPTSDWAGLSSDPQELLQQLVQLDGAVSTPKEEFTAVGDVLRMTDAPPAVRANIYRAAALIPGVESLGTVLDHSGRPGLGLAYGDEELIFDSHTGELLGETDTGPLAGWAVYLRERVVDGLPSKPPAPLRPPCARGGAGTGKNIPGGTIMTGAGLNPTR